MKHTTAMIAVLAIALVAQGATIEMDAAEQDRYGIEFEGYAAVRMIVDNRKGAETLTNVKFKVEIHSGCLGATPAWAWDDAGNPWHGVRTQSDFKTPDGKTYTQGIIIYQDNWWAPAFYIDPTPQNPGSGDEYEIFGSVPLGILWDRPTKLMGFMGGDIELFSTAEGTLDSDQITQTLYDIDEGPQTVPQPATCLMMGMGGFLIIGKNGNKKTKI